MQMAILSDRITFNLSNLILLLSITKQIAYTNIVKSDIRAIFIKAKVKRFIKSFDKALTGKHTNTIYNGQIKKELQILCQLRIRIFRLNLYLVKI